MKSADDRIYASERKISDLTTRLQNMERQRYSLTGSILRLAVTAENPDDESYPTGGNTVWVKFVDATFTEEDGDQSVTKHERTEAAGAVARTISGDLPEEDTLVVVARIGSRWWIVDTRGVPSRSIRFHNTAGETCPPGAIIEITGIELDSSEEVLVAQKPQLFGPLHSWLAVNTAGAVDEDEYGTCQPWSEFDAFPLRFHYDNTHTPAAGEEWGPKCGSWKIHRGQPGVVILGNESGGPDYLVTGMRYEIRDRAHDRLWLAANPASGQTVEKARCGMWGGSHANSHGATIINYVVECSWSTFGSGMEGYRQLVIAALGNDIDSDTSSNGFMTTGEVKPVLAECVTDLDTPTEGEQWGPCDSSGKLYPGLPGFTALGVTSPPTGHGLFMRERQMYFWARVKEDWNDAASSPPYCIAQVCADSNGTNVYDGSEAYLPDLQIYVYFPGGKVWDGSSWVLLKHPTVRIGDVILCKKLPFNGGYRSIAIGDYLDDLLGTVKLWTGSPSSLPRHWAVMDGTENDSSVDGSGYDMRGRFAVGVEDRTGGSVPIHSDDNYDIGQTGGVKSHVHSFAGGGTGGSGGAGNPMVEASHTPPWRALHYIERIR